MNLKYLIPVCVSMCYGCTKKAEEAKSPEIDPSTAELDSIFKAIYSANVPETPTVGPPKVEPPNVESLYAEWVAELRNGIVGIHVNPDGSKCLLGPGFSDAPKVPNLASCKRLAEFRPRIDMVNYCLLQYNIGDPIAGLAGYVLRAAYPGQLTGMTDQEMFQKAKLLAEGESR